MSLDHITASPNRTHVGCRPNLGKVHLETSAPERSAAHLTADITVDDMTEQVWRGKADATRQPSRHIVENVEHITERETSWLNVRHSRSECRVQAINIDRDVNTLDTFP
ncbi:hypothetical protein B296_00052544 [Ensete ventricosum]|uniref:Uncharacterized protein n=1 Tax=Ensete ventricosum TaxID=4639 RepID=A0A426YBU8_ENSVE|nr:hypothetical protein B296_00052544 [Ensete ventricosum]